MSSKQDDDDGLVDYVLPMDYHDENAPNGVYKKGETIVCTIEEKNHIDQTPSEKKLKIKKGNQKQT
jgi:hypothetical protein